MKTLHVLVVDDSAINRRTIADMLVAIPNVEVVAKASDGDEALRLAGSLKPDLITLDLEMPRMDGFTFMRLLMASRPTPVIVISGYAAKENVFRALELGAIDFIAKPQEGISENAEAIDEQLKRMVKMVRQLSPARFEPAKRKFIAPGATITGAHTATVSKKVRLPEPRRTPNRLIVVAASTGGPTALLEVFARLPAEASAAIIVAQHMPERFTRTFAERLDRLSSFRVHEAREIQTLEAGYGLVCPGGRSVEIFGDSETMMAKVVWPDASDRYAPSADRLFSSAAKVAGDRVIAVVLTGMGDDGSRGVADVKKAGGTVLVEAEETAVIYGMPKAAQRTGRVDRSLPLRELSEYLVSLIM
ncbi:MAG: chemotaxis-specific protein-glutamate methyltransferase CheB [Deltaproteobacteria bacterium]|nr:chemotaxis-specific protein-glutamate methyltransferase CheB [Deltaproteobacteria bacterium]